MGSVWAEAVARALVDALRLLAEAVRDCQAEAWESSMWPVGALGAEHQFIGSDWQPIADLALRRSLGEAWVRRRSTPWSVAWHALETLDYDLNGEFEAWSPPAPFAGHPHWRDLASLGRAWEPAEILSYVDYCRERARGVFAGMTDERAAREMPSAHRYRGRPHAWILAGLPAHTTEHAAQIRQFTMGRGPGG